MAELDRILDRFDLRTLETAMTRRRKRDRQRTTLLEQRRKLEAQLAKLSTLIGTDGGSRNGRHAPIERRPNARRLNDITLAEALEKALGSKQRTMHYKDLTDAVTKRGLYRTKSKNLLSTVAVTLMRDRRFKKVKPGIYSLR